MELAGERETKESGAASPLAQGKGKAALGAPDFMRDFMRG
jgi:hypothetical protein